MKLCACNSCGIVYEDTNPQSGALEYPDTLRFDSLTNQTDDEGSFKGCPKCKTDGNLTDDVSYWIKREPNLTIAAICYNEYGNVTEKTVDRLNNLLSLFQNQAPPIPEVRKRKL